MQIVIGEFTFPTKQAAIDAFRAVLYRDALDTEIVGEDRKLARRVLLQSAGQSPGTRANGRSGASCE